jgi:hypothetical protein
MYGHRRFGEPRECRQEGSREGALSSTTTTIHTDQESRLLTRRFEYGTRYLIE